MRENADEENSEYGHFLHSEKQFSFPHFLSFHIFIHIRIGYGDLHSKCPYTRLYCIVLYFDLAKAYSSTNRRLIKAK